MKVKNKLEKVVHFIPGVYDRPTGIIHLQEERFCLTVVGNKIS